MTMNDTGVTSAVYTPDTSLPTALEPTSKAARSSSTPITRLAYVSNFAWP